MAMLKFISYKCGIDFEKVRQTYIPKNPIRFLFDSARKRMSTVVELPANEKTEHGYNKRIHVKGASEIVLSTCKTAFSTFALSLGVLTRVGIMATP